MKRWATSGAVLVLLLAAAAVFHQRRGFSRPRTQQSSTTPCCGQPDTTAPRELDFAYYSLRGGFNSTLLLIGDAPAPFPFTISIHSLSGLTAVAPAMRVQPQQKLSIDLRTLLANIGADPEGAFSEGSISVSYASATRPLVGQVTITNATLGLVYESLMAENDPGQSDIPAMLDGLWWSLSPGRDAKVMVANTAGATVTADVFLDFAGERHPSAPVVFAPYETKVLSTTQLLGKLSFSPSQAPEGGITIMGRGAPPTLIASGVMLDPATGFSSTMHFMLMGMPMSSTLDASGVPIGTPSADSAFARAGTFTPHVVVRNLLSSPQTATVSIEYPTDNGPQTTTLAALAVGAYSTKDVSLGLAVGQLPLPLPFCTIHIQYSGPPGSAIVEVSSIEENHNLVIDSKLGDAGDPMSGSGINPWHLDDQTESVLFLADAGDKPARIGFQIQAGGVHYYLTNLKLNPHETRAIDIRKLRDQQKADFKGNKIPADATDGSVVWVKMDPVPVVGRLLVMDARQGLSSNYDCQCAFHCAQGYKALSVSPTSWTMPPGGTAVFVSTETWGDCNGVDHFYDVTPSSLWGSSNTAVCTVGNSPQSGLVTAVLGSGGGSATITATFTDSTYRWSVVEHICNENVVTKSASGTAIVRVPHHLQVVSDISGAVPACPNIIVRQIKFTVVDSSNSIVGPAPVNERFISISQNTCNNGQPLPSPCANTDNAMSEFTDTLTVNCNSVGGSCGYDITYEWQWCPPGGTAVDIGRLVETVHADQITVNGVTTPNKIPGGTNVFP